MTTYFVNDGSASPGSGYQLWENAAHNFKDLIDAIGQPTLFAAGNIIVFAHNTIDGSTWGGALTLTFPSANAPVTLISATEQASGSTVTYQAATGNQIDLNGVGSITMDGSHVIKGVRMRSNANFTVQCDTNEGCSHIDPYFVLSGGTNGGAMGYYCTRAFLLNPTFDVSADTSNTTNPVIFSTSAQSGMVEIRGGRVVKGATAYRTGSFCGNGTAPRMYFLGSGIDLSGLAVGAEIMATSVASNQGCGSFNDCKMPSDDEWPCDGFPWPQGKVTGIRCSNTDIKSWLRHREYAGYLFSETAVYRNSGATIEGENCCWHVVVSGTLSQQNMPFYSPWIEAEVASTGNSTFEVYTANDLADLTDAELWLEVEHKDVSETWQPVITSSQKVAGETATAVADDVTSTWTGWTPTYMQKLSVTANCGAAGRVRVRAGIARSAGITSANNLRIDPIVTVI